MSWDVWRLCLMGTVSAAPRRGIWVQTFMLLTAWQIGKNNHNTMENKMYTLGLRPLIAAHPWRYYWSWRLQIIDISIALYFDVLFRFSLLMSSLIQPSLWLTALSSRLECWCQQTLRRYWRSSLGFSFSCAKAAKTRCSPELTWQKIYWISLALLLKER